MLNVYHISSVNEEQMSSHVYKGSYRRQDCRSWSHESVVDHPQETWKVPILSTDEKDTEIEFKLNYIPFHMVNYIFQKNIRVNTNLWTP